MDQMAFQDNTSCTKQTNEDPFFPDIIELNVGGQVYITRYLTLVAIRGSLLWEMFSQKNVQPLARDSKGRFFLDRDGFLFRYVLDYLRDHQLVLPDHFPERRRLQREAEYFKLPELVKLLVSKVDKQNSIGDDTIQSYSQEQSPNIEVAKNLTFVNALAPNFETQSTLPDLEGSGFITIGYHGSYTLGRDNQSDSKFKRIARIMVCGKTSLVNDVFGETLNESKDPDQPLEIYTSRFCLKCNFLEQAFDRLADAGFHMMGCNSTGTCGFAHDQADDKILTTYTEYIFYRAAATLIDGNQRIRTYVTATREPAIHEIEEKIDAIPPLLIEKKQEPDSGNELSSSSLDSHDSPTVSTELPSEKNVSKTNDIFFPYDKSLPCPTTLDLSHSLKEHDQTKTPESRRNSLQEVEKENGIESCGDPPVQSKEIKALEVELVKCIEEFKKIRIPVMFPNKKRHWQNELLRKYKL
ncbi:BTB/POZ domain-containing protein KCTD12-like isoform X2 [Hyla sarda]|uniref:BTB/POZ domain-containing protein KCTD12-like isoform X2 n=1 Tax=Hyla sarda TaxID=327740 RepID=UPI0024C290C7|nr:BTB/POZ domain-containing protein KCTD12-like isoform X2 [Hyla sarda]